MSPAIRQLVFFLLLGAIPVAAFVFVFKPQNEEIQKANKEIEHKEAMLEKLREATAQTDDLQRANEQIRERIAAIEARLPSTKEMDNVLRQVSNLARDRDLRVPDFRKSDRPLGAGVALEQPIDIEITGNFDGFYQFLLALEQLPRVTRITELEIKRSEEPDGNMEAKFVLSIYYSSDRS